MNAPDLANLPKIPLDNGEPIFNEPWQAQAFAMTVALHEGGAFEWEKWAETLSAQLATDAKDDGSHYWHHWLAALETLMTAKGATSPEALDQRTQQWHEAAARTPHGEAIEL